MKYTINLALYYLAFPLLLAGLAFIVIGIWRGYGTIIFPGIIIAAVSAWDIKSGKPQRKS